MSRRARKAMITRGHSALSLSRQCAHSGLSAHPFRQHPPTRTGLSAHLLSIPA